MNEMQGDKKQAFLAFWRKKMASIFDKLLLQLLLTLSVPSLAFAQTQGPQNSSRALLKQNIAESFPTISTPSDFYIHGGKLLIAAVLLNKALYHKLNSGHQLSKGQKKLQLWQSEITQLQREIDLASDEVAKIRTNEIFMSAYRLNPEAALAQLKIDLTIRSSQLKSSLEAKTSALTQLNALLSQQTNIETLMVLRGVLDDSNETLAREIADLENRYRYTSQALLEIEKSQKAGNSIPDFIQREFDRKEKLVAKIHENQDRIRAQSILLEKVEEKVKFHQNLNDSWKIKGLRFLGIWGSTLLLVDSAGALYLAYYLGQKPTVSPLSKLIREKTPHEMAQLLTQIPAAIIEKIEEQMNSSLPLPDFSNR